MRARSTTGLYFSLPLLLALVLALAPLGGCKDDKGSTDSDAAVPGPDAASGECPSGPLSAPIPGCTPTPVPDTGDPYADCVARINQFRWDCQCLPPLARWTDGESCADEHAEYDSTHSAHAGINDGICTPGGSAQNECPGWDSVGQVIDGCLQVMWDEGPGEPYSEHGHYINMSNTAYGRVACGFYTTGGGSVWSVQNFSQ